MANQPTEFNLNMDEEVKLRAQQSSATEAAERQLDSGTSTEIAAKIDQYMRDKGLDPNASAVGSETIQRDLDYQRQLETMPQPESAPQLMEQTTPELDRLETLQKELDATKAEAIRWKKEFGRREGTVGQMKSELQQLKAQVQQIQPAINVQQITGREPGEAITAQDAVNLLMSQSQAFGNAMQRLRDELLSQAASPQNDGLPLDMEAELVEAHPWLTDLPRPQKMRAMHDILASSGVSVAPQPSVASGQPQRPLATLPESARAQVRQAAFIEPSNRGSAAERTAVQPERQAFNDKVEKLNAALKKPGGSDEARRILASLGAGVVDETQIGYLNTSRR